MGILRLHHQWLAILIVVMPLLITQQSVYPQQSALNGCPTELKTLTSMMLKDLPNYANRVIQTTQELNSKAGIDNYIITAGQAEFEPLNLPQIQYHPSSPSPPQIFFTVLERQYANHRKIERRTYHWLFLAQTSSGWQMVTMYSRFGSSTQETPPTPPQESSNGIIGQAVNLWLRDCRAGAIGN